VSLADNNNAYSAHLDGLKSLGLLNFWSPIPQRLSLGVGLLKVLDYMRDPAQHTEYYFTDFDYEAYNIELVYGIGVKEMGLHGLTMEDAAIVSANRLIDAIIKILHFIFRMFKTRFHIRM
jgi:hypothetical protein